MNPTEIAITRKFNLGNYQTMDIKVSAGLNVGEDTVQAFHALEKLIMDYWEARASNLVAKEISKKETQT